MIVLDTNVLSEPLRSAPDAQVILWLDSQPVETLFLTAITLAEMRYGIAALPEGRRRRELRRGFENDIVPVFRNRILPFDAEASEDYARVQAEARAMGRAMSAMDALIAEICVRHDFALATHNVRDFERVGIDVIDPWKSVDHDGPATGRL